MRIVLAAALALAAAGPAAAVTYDAFNSFTGTNTGGAFTYGVFNDTTSAATFTPYNDTPGCAALISNVICTSNGSLPAAFKSTSGAHQSGSVIVPGDALVLHPGPDAGESSGVVFTAPTAGQYYVRINAFIADTSPSGTIFELFIPVLGSRPLATLTAANPSYTYNGPLAVAPAGQQIGFAVNYDGVYNNDSTGLQLTVSTAPIPEPATWVLMIAGFGLVGGALRLRTAKGALL